MECETFLNLSDDFRNICPTSSYMNLPFLSNSLLAKHPLNMNCWTSLRFNFMVEKFKHFGQVRNTPGAWALENDRNDEDLGDKQLIYFGSLSFSTLVICIFRIPSSDSLWVFRVSESKTLLLKFLFILASFGLDWCQIWLLINKLVTRCGRQWRSAAQHKWTYGWLSTTIPIILKI